MIDDLIFFVCTIFNVNSVQDLTLADTMNELKLKSWPLYSLLLSLLLSERRFLNLCQLDSRSIYGVC